jgi:hypothetical protein
VTGLDTVATLRMGKEKSRRGISRKVRVHIGEGFSKTYTAAEARASKEMEKERFAQVLRGEDIRFLSVKLQLNG